MMFEKNEKFLSIIREFTGNDDCTFETIGKYVLFITCVQEAMHYSGGQVYTDVYYNDATEQYLFIRSCYSHKTILSIRKVNVLDFKLENEFVNLFDRNTVFKKIVFTKSLIRSVDNGIEYQFLKLPVNSILCRSC